MDSWRGSLHRPTRCLHLLGTSPFRDVEYRSPPLAQRWQILGVESKGPGRPDRAASDGIPSDGSVTVRKVLRHKECRPSGYSSQTRLTGFLTLW